MSLHPARC